MRSNERRVGAVGLRGERLPMRNRYEMLANKENEGRLATRTSRPLQRMRTNEQRVRDGDQRGD